MSSSSPPGRKGHQISYLAKSIARITLVEALFLAGGKDSGYHVLSDIWIFFLERDVWTKIKTPKGYIPRFNFAVK